jgi:hypothetical protein
MEASTDVPSKAARSPEELFPLIEYCRAGKLKEVSEWIAANKPLDPPANVKPRRRRGSPLQIAIEKGFYSLTELLLDGGADPNANGSALYDAVSKDEVDIARLLLERGAAADSVDMQTVFDVSPAMLALFIDNGADPSSEDAYYHALRSKVHPLLSVLKNHKERFPDLQRQADMALCYHSEQGNARNVGLLIWAGARPDAEVPDPNYSDSTCCAISVAVRRGRMDILKQLKPQNYPKTLATLFAEVWFTDSSPALVDYLIGLGAPLNTKPNGDSEMLEHLLWRMNWGPSGPFGRGTDTVAIVRMIEQICRLGAKWIPEPDETERNVRDRFRKIEPQTLRDLFRIFKETGAVSIQVMESVLASPALRKSLGSHLRSIQNIVHPPPLSPKPLKPPVETTHPEETPPGSPRLTIAQLRHAAEAVLLDVIRQKPHLHFTMAQVSEYIEVKKVRKAVDMAKDDERELRPILETAAANLNKRLKTFRVGVESSQLIASLNEDAEWSEAISEAWSYVDKPNEFGLSNPGLSLLEYIRSGDLKAEFVLERSISYKMGLNGRERCIEPYLREVRRKALVDLNWEKKNTQWGKPPMYRLWIAKDEFQPIEAPRAVNPVFKNRLEAFTKVDVDALRALIYDHLLRLNPIGDDDIYLVAISRRRELQHCFPHSTSRISDVLVRFFSAISLNPELRRAYDFRDHAPVWTFSLQPKSDWKTTLAAIRADLAQPSLQDRFGLSCEAAKLLRWIEQLPDDTKLLGRLTPVVEDANEQWIGLNCAWRGENTGVYLQLLIDEINDRTDYELKLQPWHEWNAVKSRIVFKRKKSAALADLLARLDRVCAKLEATLPSKESSPGSSP